MIAQGPVASQEAIKMLGTNGGGFFNANSAHPFENPTPFSNFLQMVAIFAIPSGLTYTLGRMTGSPAHGWAVWNVMADLFAAGVITAYWAESRGILSTRELTSMPALPSRREYGGQRSTFRYRKFCSLRNGDDGCELRNNQQHARPFTPLGGMVLMINIMLSEVVFGGVGAGMYGILIYVVLAVFIAGLMVGRTPEYLGKKIEALTSRWPCS